MSKNTIINGCMFIAGAIIGSVGTWKLLKTKYDHIIAEEIESVKEAFATKKDISEDKDTKLSDGDKFHVDKSVDGAAKKEKIINEAQEISAKSGYVYEFEDYEEDDDMTGPYIISPEAFGEEGYVIISFDYYQDGVVINENGKIVKNANELFGKGFADHFGDYPNDPDVVYVRNDELGVDYEIVMDSREYYGEAVD